MNKRLTGDAWHAAHPPERHGRPSIYGHVKGPWTPEKARLSNLMNRRQPGVQLRNRLRKYGLTEAQFNAMMLAQCGRCAICTETLDPAHIDHKAERVRGLLCPNCNKGIGLFRDEPAALRAAADYVTEAA